MFVANVIQRTVLKRENRSNRSKITCFRGTLIIIFLRQFRLVRSRIFEFLLELDMFLLYAAEYF